MVRGTPFLAVSPVMRLKLSVRRTVDSLGNALAVGSETTSVRLNRKLYNAGAFVTAQVRDPDDVCAVISCCVKIG